MGFSLPHFILCRSAAETGPCALNSDPSGQEGFKGNPIQFLVKEEGGCDRRHER